MEIKKVWSYFYAIKDALSMLEAFFVFSRNDSKEVRDLIEGMYSDLSRLGTLISEVNNNDN